MSTLIARSSVVLASIATAGGIVVAAPSVVGATTAPAPAATHTATPGQRIVTVAKRYVGKVKYRTNGASPKHGFDCSGYTSYVVRKAHVGKLPHSAEGQRHNKHMHAVSAKHAKPGDLVFYGKPAYHVAIYAGHHKQYTAAETGTKIKKQKIWGHVTYKRYIK